MSQARIVDHVYHQLWPEYGKPTHPEDVANLRDMIADVVSHALAYLDEPVRWQEPDPQTAVAPNHAPPAASSGHAD